MAPPGRRYPGMTLTSRAISAVRRRNLPAWAAGPKIEAAQGPVMKYPQDKIGGTQRA